MPLTEGTEYVFAPKASYFAKTGHVKACLLGTNNIVLAIPIDTLLVQRAYRFFKSKTTIHTIGDKNPVEALHELLGDAEMTLETLEVRMKEWARDMDGSLYFDLDEMVHMKTKAGWLSRGIYLKPPKKLGYEAIPINGKEHALRVKEFYANHQVAQA